MSSFSTTVDVASAQTIRSWLRNHSTHDELVSAVRKPAGDEGADAEQQMTAYDAAHLAPGLRP
jgi:hypothetical protein